MTKFFDFNIIRVLKHRNFTRIIYAFLIFIVTIASGVVGYVLIEHMTMFDAFYMTIITVSTVGFNEVQPLSSAGKHFTIFLIIFNIGAFTYALSVLSSFILEGDLKKILKSTNMEKNIEGLKNHVIIFGYGRLGRIVSEDIAESGQRVLIVERNPLIISELAEKEKLYYKGDGTDEETILAIGIEKASALITTLHSDAENVFIVLAARELNQKIKIISRASNESNISKLKLAGANEVIIPEDIGGSYIASLVTKTD